MSRDVGVTCRVTWHNSCVGRNKHKSLGNRARNRPISLGPIVAYAILRRRHQQFIKLNTFEARK